ncbi:hypothetical protein [Streptomyces solaniscabiei]|uniref:hypothetical protein n=1 Tax=Streptomyces solaniscabiei TaxID=2683255 RepID=UPI001CE2E99B|nr:hypothetical protein [Streptomyces solaniscabiei]
MWWGRTRPGAAGPRRAAWPDDEWDRAAALCAAQLPSAVLLLVIVGSGRDDYGAGYGGAFGLACFFVLGWLLVPPLGLLHALVQIMPAAALARLQRRHCGGPEWAWHLTTSVLVGVCWAVLLRALWGLPLAATVPWLAGAGVLPVLGLAYLRRRRWGDRGIWLRSAGGCLVLLVVTGVGGAVLVDDYEPPVLSASQVAGTWHGVRGARLRLWPGGRAELTRVPAEAVFEDPGDFTVCDGTGTWTLDREGDHHAGREGVLVRLDGGCGEETYWTIGGSERQPELFVIFGDPDAGELRILSRG